MRSPHEWPAASAVRTAGVHVGTWQRDAGDGAGEGDRAVRLPLAHDRRPLQDEVDAIRRLVLCHELLAGRHRESLAAREEEVAQVIGADKLIYQDMEDLVRVIGDEHGCPYYMSQAMAPAAHMVICVYNYIRENGG